MEEGLVCTLVQYYYNSLEVQGLLKVLYYPLSLDIVPEYFQSDINNMTRHSPTQVYIRSCKLYSLYKCIQYISYI